MKTKLLSKMKAGFLAFLQVASMISIVIFGICFLLSFPIIGYHYAKFAGMCLGIIISGFLVHAGRWVYKSIKARTFKALLSFILESIIFGNYAVIATVIFVFILSLPCSAGESIKAIPKPIWQSLFFFYYCIVVPVAILFGTFMSFGYKDFKELLEKQNSVINGIGTKQELEGWEREKFQFKYLNPILLPFSIVFFSIKFLLKFIKVIGSAFKELCQTLYQENMKEV